MSRKKVKDGYSKKELRAIVREAKSVNNNDFVQSCAKFLDERGFLSEKQIAALQNIRPKSDFSEYYDNDAWEFDYEFDNDWMW